MYYNLFIQSLAIIALVIWGASYHFKKRKTILLVQLGSFIFWITHFFLLGAYTGAILTVIAGIRLALFTFKKKNNLISRPVVLGSFILILIVFTFITFSSYWSLFALIGGIFATLATWQDKQKRIRQIFIPSHIAWIIYDLSAGSFGGAISEGVLCISAIISLFRKNL